MPRGYDPTPPAGGPMPGRAQAQALRSAPVRRAISTARGPGGTPGGLVTSPAVTVPRRSGRLAVRRRADGRVGLAEARAGLYRPA